MIIMGTKVVKIADICIDGEFIDIEGEVKEEAWVFEKHYDAEDTQNIIDNIRDKEYLISRKFDRKGYIFNDDIGMLSVETEVIQYLLEYCLNRKIGFGQELGQQGRAIYYDKSYVRRDGRQLANMLEELYNKHYGIN